MLGAAIGAFTCMKVGDWLGRRWTIFCATTIAIIGAILMASAFSLAQLSVARLVLGFGSGGYTATIPVWVSNHASSQRLLRRRQCSRAIERTLTLYSNLRLAEQSTEELSSTPKAFSLVLGSSLLYYWTSPSSLSKATQSAGVFHSPSKSSSYWLSWPLF